MKAEIKDKISATLKRYYLTEAGINHRNKLASTMRDRMRLYNEFLAYKNNNNDLNHLINHEK